ncbi:hypothetical protein EV196_104168 [Mariniflexile fucanivorans]|uniref:NIPSNAP protein n=1 Tax=Mariniflexile fucanivorans TaxID=264023 RepID=A0A4R1RJ30_9FLAO|nr:hypothetical protein [Mariniflexile fucanivorans]TCL66138.1 hypothetical protein EV196_104168 [Mariniflexile fucanivorans]
MKILKNTLFGILLLCMITLVANAQNQAYWVHTDYVKPAKQNDYEKVCKDFVEACKKHDLKDADWASIRIDDGRYLTIAPIKNMADFDANPLEPLAEKMGKENFSALFERFNTCYDKHTDYVIHLNADLSYMPNGMNVSTPNQDYRKYHFFYVTPSTSKIVSEKIKAIKEFYAKKGLKEQFRIYHSGFGSPEEFYVAVLSAKDAQDYIKTSNEAEAQYGEEGKKLFDALFSSISRYETKSGEMRPDLGYVAKNN